MTSSYVSSHAGTLCAVPDDQLPEYAISLAKTETNPAALQGCASVHLFLARPDFNSLS